MERPSIDFGVRKVGDVISLPSPFVFCEETLAKLLHVFDGEQYMLHKYGLFLFGVWIGDAEATLEKKTGKVSWRMITFS